MTWLIGWDADGQRMSINLANARTITVYRNEQEPDEDSISVEWSESETLRTVMAKGAFVSDDPMAQAPTRSRKARP